MKKVVTCIAILVLCIVTGAGTFNDKAYQQVYFSIDMYWKTRFRRMCERS